MIAIVSHTIVKKQDSFLFGSKQTEIPLFNASTHDGLMDCSCGKFKFVVD